ncbi:MAG: elongation factor G [Bacteroidales bacterium]|jgi:elongation factor G|nr:elongation factor G [Bacteroidales bacterium]MDD4213258.1 elongation factor G [Bacteroidales bacterium]
MKVYQTNEIKNIALIGGAKSGKTTLAECMLFEGGVIKRRGSVEDNNTVSDYREIELERQNSVYSTVMYTEYAGKKINIIDNPGFDDFIGEVFSSLKVCETALMVVNAQNGVEVGTEITWRHTNKQNVPVIFVVNQLEHEKANFEENIRQLKNQFGAKVTLVQYALNTGIGFDSVVDLLKMKLFKYNKDGKAEILDIPDSEKVKAEELHAALIEAAAESDESLMEIFFDKGTLTEEELFRGIKLGITHRNLFPVLCTSSKNNLGVSSLLEFIANSTPSPDEVAPPKTVEGKDIPCIITEPASAFIFKTSIETHIGEVSYFKVLSGEITEALDMVNVNNSTKERISQVFVCAGKNREKIAKVVAGDFAATIKLKNSYTNNTLNFSKNSEIQLKPIEFPNPKYRVAVKALNTADDEKLGGILNDMRKIDPTLIPEYSKELKQLILHGQGELHLTIAKWQIEKINKIDIEFLPPRIPYRETITKQSKSVYRHKKQSGGAGQFGEVHLLIQPFTENMVEPTEFPIRGKEQHELSWGGKLIFHNCIVGGSIDARFMPAILKGIMEKMEEGPLTGSYARDIAVYIYDGKMHPVDSNEISFKLAGRNAFKEAFKNAGPKILEPIYDVEVIVPEDKMGDVMTDLQGRRAVIMGMDSEGNYQKILAKVPLAEMNRYSTALSSITSGRATYGMKFSEYTQVPGEIQTQLLKAYEEQEKDEE